MTGDRGWLRYDAPGGRLTLTLHIQPNARKSSIVGVHGDALKVRVAAPAVDNKANAALIEFLGETLGVPRSAVNIRQGATSRRKIIEITGGSELEQKASRLT
ncbi:MAG TPA: DUF167 domain-containing protein [Burkholderiales bacterium]|nr:DUF167 domain-containing protein [Burkholderiales bacterium]